MRTTFTALRSTLLTLLAVIGCSTAFAQNTFELGVGANYGNGVTANVHANIPLFEAFELQHSVRPQITYAFDGLPAVSATYVATGKPAGETLDRYLGAGVGVSFPAEPLSRVLLSAHGLLGFRIPLTNSVHAFTEVALASSSLGTNVALGAGFRYAFGGTK